MKKTLLSKVRTILVIVFALAPFGASGNTVYVSYWGSFGAGGIEKFAADGTGTVFVDSTFSGDFYPTYNPTGLALDAAGNLYEANYGYGAIDKFTPSGIGSHFSNPNVVGPLGIAFDRNGNLYDAGHNQFNQSVIERIAPDGSYTSFPDIRSNGSGGPVGLAFDSAGNLYVANDAYNVVDKYTFGPFGSVVGSVFVSTGLSNPHGLAFDSEDNLFVSNNSGGNIMKFTPAGTGSVFASTGLSYPDGLAFDSAGNLFVVDGGPRTILKFAPDGSSSVFATMNGKFPQFIAIQPDAAPEPTICALLATTLLLGTARRSRGALVERSGVDVRRSFTHKS